MTRNIGGSIRTVCNDGAKYCVLCGRQGLVSAEFAQHPKVSSLSSAADEYKSCSRPAICIKGSLWPCLLSAEYKSREPPFEHHQFLSYHSPHTQTRLFAAKMARYTGKRITAATIN